MGPVIPMGCRVVSFVCRGVMIVPPATYLEFCTLLDEVCTHLNLPPGEARWRYVDGPSLAVEGAYPGPCLYVSRDTRSRVFTAGDGPVYWPSTGERLMGVKGIIQPFWPTQETLEGCPSGRWVKVMDASNLATIASALGMVPSPKGGVCPATGREVGGSP